MENTELHPIPEGSVITEAMVEATMAFYKIERDAAIGTLLNWEHGAGELDANLVEGEATREIMQPVRDSYFTASGKEKPELPPIDAGAQEVGVGSTGEAKTDESSSEEAKSDGEAGENEQA